MRLKCCRRVHGCARHIMRHLLQAGRYSQLPSTDCLSSLVLMILMRDLHPSDSSPVGVSKNSCPFL